MSGAFAKTTFGPPAPGTTDTNKGALIADVQSGVCEMVDMSGNTHGIETMLSLLQAQTALTTVTTAQTLFTVVCNPGQLNKKNRMLRVFGTLIYTTTNAAQFTVVLKLGSVTLISIQSAASAASVTNGQIAFDFVVSVASTGTSGTLEAHGQLMVQLSGTLSTAVAQYQDQNTAVSSAVDLTATENLVATIAASNTVASIQVRQATVEVIN